MSGASGPGRRSWLFAPPWPRVPPPFLALALITGTAGFSIHTILPALPGAAAGLGVSAGVIQLTLTVYMFGQCIGQLIHGPLSDRFGRRPVLLMGLIVYVLSGIVTVFAPSAEWLIGARIAQSLGGCAGTVLGRAIARETNDHSRAARMLALLGLMLSIAPAIGPAVGGWLVEYFGWRAPFALMLAIGTCALAWIWAILPETNKRAGTFELDVAGLLRGYGRLLRSRDYVCCVLITACGTTSIYVFLVNSPFIFTELLHMTVVQASKYYVVMVAGFAAGSFTASRIATRVRALPVAVICGVLELVGGLIFVWMWASGDVSVIGLIVGIFLFTAGGGAIQPFTATAALSINPALVGTAAGLMGFWQFAWGGILTGLAGLMHGDLMFPVAFGLTIAGVMALTCTFIARKTLSTPRN